MPESIEDIIEQLSSYSPNLFKSLFDGLNRDITNNPNIYLKESRSNTLEEMNLEIKELNRSNYHKFLKDHLDIFTAKEILDFKKASIIEIINHYNSTSKFIINESNGKSMWALLTSPDKLKRNFGKSLLPFYQRGNQSLPLFLKGFSTYLTGLRQSIYQEVRIEFKSRIRELTKEKKVLEAKIQQALYLNRPKKQDSKKPKPKTTLEPVKKQDYSHEIRTLEKKLERTKDSIIKQEGDYQKLEEKYNKLTSTPTDAGFTFQDYHDLSDFYRGRKVIVVGGSKTESPYGTTKKYIEFLKDKLQAEIVHIPSETKTTRLKDQLRGNHDAVLINLVYCSNHKLENTINNNKPKYQVKITSSTYDEQDYVRQLLKPVKTSKT